MQSSLRQAVRRVTHRGAKRVIRRARKTHARRQPSVVVAGTDRIDRLERDESQPVSAGVREIEGKLTDGLAVRVAADDRHFRPGTHGVDVDLARRCGRSGRQERDAHGPHRLRLRLKAHGGVLARLVRAVHDRVLGVGRRAVAAEQVVDQLGRADETATVVTQVDDEVADVLRAERLERRAQLRVGGADVAAQVQVTHAGRSGHGQDLRSERIRDRVDRHRALGQPHIDGLPVAQHTQAALDSYGSGSKQVGERGGSVRERLRDRHEAAALVDGDDLVAAL